MAKKFYLTTPIYYPNDIPHIGHAYTTIAADVLARWYKLRGYSVFFLTGTDDHGKKILQAAKKNGKSPKKFTDELVPKFKDAWKKLNVEYDRFIRTTDSDHEKIVSEILQKVYDNGDIYLGKYEGFYCVSCEAYYTEKDLENGNCPTHKIKIEKVKEESYFFKLSKYQKKLTDFYEKNPDFIQPKNRRQEIINRVKEGLNDLSISRKDFDWGVPMPFDKKHICYVWFDALFNYYSATREKGKEKFWPADLHIIGKDILWFHAVYWPAFLLSAGIKIPKSVFAHGWWTFDNEKISKSRGKVVNVDELIKIAGVDSARYFLLRETPFGDDGDFSEKSLIDRHNNELADKLGNLVSRVSALAERYGVGKVKHKKRLSNDWKKKIINGSAKLEVLNESPGENMDMRIFHLSEEDKGGISGIEFSEDPIGLAEVINFISSNFISKYEFDKALNEIFLLIDYCNWFVQTKKPWETHDKKVLYELVESIKVIADLLLPFVPETSEKIKKVFSTKKIKKSEVLFVKIK